MNTELMLKIHQGLHIFAGAITLFAAPIAIATNRNSKVHVVAGKAFFFAMLYVCASAIASYFRAPSIFFFFLMCIAGMVLMGIIPAVRAIKMMKGGAAKNTDILVGIGGMILGGGMIAKGLTGLAVNSNDVISILITFFGVSTIGTGLMTYRAFSNPTRLHRLDWLLLHVRLMMGGFIASTTAFVVNVKFFQQFPDVVIWLAPTFLITPIQIYFTSRIRKQRDSIVAKK